MFLEFKPYGKAVFGIENNIDGNELGEAVRWNNLGRFTSVSDSWNSWFDTLGATSAEASASSNVTRTECHTIFFCYVHVQVSEQKDTQGYCTYHIKRRKLILLWEFF